MNTELECYLLRKTSLTLQDIGKLTPIQFNAIVKEVNFQESIEDYQRQHSVASILAAIYNTIPRKQGSKVYTAKDFLNTQMPVRGGQPTDSNVDALARKKGIILPNE